MIERTFDWKSHHDERSKNYSIEDKIGIVEPVKKYWPIGVVLDQGQEGSCVGHGWTGELVSSPRPFKTAPEHGHEFAVNLYSRAKVLDEWPGEDYSGTSVLAGAKAVVEKGFMGSYRWAFGVEDVRSAVISEGPVVIGIPWRQGMYEASNGVVSVTGNVVGGHCLVLTGYNPRARLVGQPGYHEIFRWRNSWGLGYGLNGNAFIKIEDLAGLLYGGGEACVPQDRKAVKF